MSLASDWLAGNRREVAEALTERQYAREPDLMRRYGADGRRRCLEDALYHLDYLTQAVETRRPVLFAEYVAWAKVLLAQLGIPPDHLRTNLELLRQLLQERAGVHAELVTAPIAVILGDFDTLPTSLDSHIDPASNPHAAVARRYLDLLLAGQRRQAIELVLGAVDDGLSVRDVYLRVFQPVQYEIGRLWQMNRVTIAQEHVCTAATQLVMSQLYPRLFHHAPAHRRILVACVSGDLHEVGARILADFFEMEGWDTTYVGANTPTRGIVEMAIAEQSNVVALSATMVNHVPQLREAITALRKAVTHASLIVGGYPFLVSPDLWQELGADGSAEDAERAVVLADGLAHA